MKVLVVGAGPAGLAAAETLARAGAAVTVVERQTMAGGVPRLCGHSPFGMREFHRIMGGAAYAERLSRAATRAGARILTRHAVTAIDERVHLSTPDGPLTQTPDRILLATGAREASRAERLLPGERPQGIMTTGALQDLWFARGIRHFRRPVILGSELVAMSAILTCRQAGARPVTLVDSGAMTVRAPFRWLPRILGLPVHLRCDHRGYHRNQRPDQRHGEGRHVQRRRVIDQRKAALWCDELGDFAEMLIGVGGREHEGWLPDAQPFDLRRKRFWTAPGLPEGKTLGELPVMEQTSKKKTSKPYSPEFRERAVRLAMEHRDEYQSEAAALTAIASKLGCSPDSLRAWVRQAQRDGGKRPALTSADKALIKEIERENRELRQANEILKKASAYFAMAELDRPFRK